MSTLNVLEKQEIKNDNIDNENKKIKDKINKETKNDAVKMYMNSINRYNLLNFEEEKELSKKIQEEGDEKALNKLINSNLRLVVKIARHYISTGYPFIDLIQDGNMGLIKAATKYDYRKNVRFSTYASWWIKQTIVRSLSIKKRLIRLSHRKEEKLRKIKKARNKFYQTNDHQPTNEELAEILNLPVKEIKEISALSANIVSLDDNVNNDDNFTIENILGDESYIPDTLIEKQILSKETEKVLNTLTEREKTIITFRYGFESTKKYTLKKIGEMFGISAETVRQIELKALNKIKEKFPYLEDFLN